MNMKNLSLHVVMASTLLLAMACNKKQSIFLPSSSGLPYELMVVSSDEMWNNPSGRALFDVLDTDVPALPQSERSFRISHSTKNGYSRLLKTFRNIIEVDISPTYTQTKFKYTRDKYASPQMIMTIQSPDEASLAEYVSENGQTIIDFFTAAEMNREVEALKDKHSRPVLDSVKAIFGCELLVPSDIQSLKVGKDFLWATNTYNGASSIQSFVVYSYPYADKNTFTRDYFIHKRDSVMKVNIPGGKPGQYMATDSTVVLSKDASFRALGHYMQDVRGLWQMENDFMGGPFVSHSLVDEMNGRVIVVEAFVFAPDKKKGDLMRKLEAALYTLKLPADMAVASSAIIPEVLIEENEETVEKTE